MTTTKTSLARQLRFAGAALKTNKTEKTLSPRRQNRLSELLENLTSYAK